MNFDELSAIILDGLKIKIESHQGLYLFAKERAKFEGWLKVELCDSLFRHFKDVVPEKNRIDVTFDNWAIELKTLNTNIRYGGVENKHRPITNNTDGVIQDIEKLKSLQLQNKAVLFIVFPILHDNQNWAIQFKRISAHLQRINHVQFYFKNNIPGVIYLGLI